MDPFVLACALQASRWRRPPAAVDEETFYSRHGPRRDAPIPPSLVPVTGRSDRQR
jgi:hypothetical protein